MELPIDVGSLFLPDCFEWLRQASDDPDAEVMGDLLCIRQLVPSSIKMPTHMEDVLLFFGIPADYSGDPQRLWEKVSWIRQFVFDEMQALTGDEYRLDWSRRDGSLCIWYRSRDLRQDASRDLTFVRENTLPIIDNAEIRESAVHGFGLFATAPIRACTTLATLDGQWMSYDEYVLLRERLGRGLGRMRNHYFSEYTAVGSKVLVRPFRTTFSLINHSPDPNLMLMFGRGRPEVVAIHGIEPGDELFLDYREQTVPLSSCDQSRLSFLANPLVET